MLLHFDRLTMGLLEIKYVGMISYNYQHGLLFIITMQHKSFPENEIIQNALLIIAHMIGIIQHIRLELPKILPLPENAKSICKELEERVKLTLNHADTIDAWKIGINFATRDQYEFALDTAQKLKDWLNSFISSNIYYSKYYIGPQKCIT